jgi:3D (Asp-Asp-Asp) domain-containing protein
MMTQIDREQSALAGVSGLVRDGIRYLADLIDRIVNGLKGIAPLVLGIGCQTGIDPGEQEPVQLAMVSQPAPIEARHPAFDQPKALGDFNVTFYYVIGEEEVLAKKPAAKRPANDNQQSGALPVGGRSPGIDRTDPEIAAAIVPPDLVTLFSGTCEPIAEVSREFASQLALQGTGKLRDGRVLNIWGACKCERSPCFKVTEAQWGTGGSGRALQPFRSVAVDPKLIKLGSLLYVPILEGRLMPGRAPWGGFVHDGCVVADDVGGGIKDKQLDLFVGRRGWFLGVSSSEGMHSWARHVPVFDGTKLCERKGRVVARKTGAI